MCNKIFEIGSPVSLQNKKNHLTEAYRVVLKNFILSFVPLAILPLYKFLKYDYMSLVNLLEDVIASSEVVYICVLILLTIDSMKRLRKLKLRTFNYIVIDI